MKQQMQSAEQPTTLPLRQTADESLNTPEAPREEQTAGAEEKTDAIETAEETETSETEATTGIVRRRRFKLVEIAGPVIAIMSIVVAYVAIDAEKPEPTTHTSVHPSDKITRVLDGGAFDLKEGGYHWLSDHETLVFRGSQANGWTLVRYDVTTKKAVPLKKVSALFNKDFGQPRLLCVSPDGRKLLWPDNSASPARYAKCVTIDGKNVVRTLLNGPWPPAWFQDSAHWAETIADQSPTWIKMVVHSADGVGAPQETYLNMAGFLDQHYDMRAGNPIIDNDSLTVVADRGGQNAIATWRLHSNYQPVSLTPTGARGSSVFISPQGNRLAFIEWNPRPTTWSKKLKARLTEKALTPDKDVYLSAGNPDGSNSRKITPLETVSYGTLLLGRYRVQWLPDGKHVSFLFEDAVYTVPVE